MLADPAVAKTYLEECLADGDPELFMAALKYVAEAQGGMGKLARKAKLSRETLYRTLSVSGNPRLDTLTRILSSLGLQLSLKNIAVRAARP
ncbi:MAG: putative addiction module antidote protein [Alphaproteobacteria bacterium]|nr:putative addiction module antidote protein [Alphaproteobacteria bacterium]NDC55861.1 putative addiction module antidote protein [Alphaproteobacteria bacterium]NDG04083.1 putative addiction module antidote protein [Alphaproteobacteria bacterium]